jgi:hypothetical protein
MRINGTLPYSKVGTTILYDYDVLAILSKNRVNLSGVVRGVGIVFAPLFNYKSMKTCLQIPDFVIDVELDKTDSKRFG